MITQWLLVFTLLAPTMTFARSSDVVLGQSFLVGIDEEIESLVVIGGSGEIQGRVEELVAIGSKIDLAPSAVVSDELVSLGSEIHSHPGARIEAERVQIGLPGLLNWIPPGGPWRGEWRADSWGWFWSLGRSAFAFVLLLFLGFLYRALFTDFVAHSVKRLDDKRMASFGWGALAHFLVLPVAILLILTLIGILFLPLYFVAYGLFLLAGHLTAGQYLGERILKSSRPASSFQPMALGIGILALLRFVPWLGTFLSLVLTVAGFGAVLCTLFEAVKLRGGGRPSTDSTGSSPKMDVQGTRESGSRTFQPATN